MSLNPFELFPLRQIMAQEEEEEEEANQAVGCRAPRDDTLGPKCVLLNFIIILH